jgi:hypothetical protein
VDPAAVGLGADGLARPGQRRAGVRELVARHEQERLPLGAVWIDNPFEKRIGDLAPSPSGSRTSTSWSTTCTPRACASSPG